MRPTRRSLRAWLGLLLVASLPAAAQLPEATVELSPELIGVSELAELRVTVHSPSLETMEPPRFLLDNLEELSGPETAVGTRDARGGRTIVFRWVLRPHHVGRARVYGLRVSAGSRRLELPVRRLEVQALPTGQGPIRARPPEPSPAHPARPTTPPPREPHAPTEPRVFLQAEARPARPWLGEQVEYTLYLYYQSDVHSIRPLELPDFDGFWAEEISVPGKAPGEVVSSGGERFERAVMLRRALFPLRAGSVSISPVSAEMVATGADGRGRSLRRTSNTIELEVRELPEPAPESFYGTVGELELSATLEPPTVAAGEPVAWVVRATSPGRLGLVELPAPDLGPSLADAGGDEPSSERRVARGRIVETRTWRRWLVPQQAGPYRLPPIEIAAFDPGTGSYHEVRADAPELLVSPGGGAEPAAPEPRSGERTVGTTAPPNRAGNHRALLLGLLVALAGAGLTTPPGRRFLRRAARRLRLGKDPVFERLEAEIENAFALPTTAASVAAVEAAWRSFLAERHPELAALPARDWSRALGPRRRRTAAEAQRFAEDLELLRRAPRLADAEALKTAVSHRSRDLARELRRHGSG
ncbi:MAG: BatD family protein [Acidobacteria bacterium]|nr:BatD family protein [Acidobacteriota bacterium]